MKKYIPQAVSYMVAFLFIYTGIMKLIDHGTLKGDINWIPVIKNFAPVFSVMLPLVEITVAACLLFDRTRKWSLFAAFILMSIFSIYVGYMLLYIPNRPCTCGGIIKQMNWHQHFYFNISFTLLSLIAFFLERSRTKKIQDDSKMPHFVDAIA